MNETCSSMCFLALVVGVPKSFDALEALARRDCLIFQQLSGAVLILSVRDSLGIVDIFVHK